jgi:transcriptional regulator GlxA family with amidase domain
VVLPSADDPPDSWRPLSVALLLREIHEPRPGGAVMVARILELMFIQILRAWAALNRDRVGWLTAAMDPGMGRALTAIHQDFAQPLTVRELARIANLSRSTFADRFSALMGQPPAAYLAGHRLDRAATLLRNDDSSVAAIAAAVGYGSESAFSRAFRRRFGASPLRWRRRTVVQPPAKGA